ncbi:MAG: hypothetical protein Q8Q31_03860 [Nanoarchaeota archaeon]|nr:hypothetical protein [Nanoarchaeota archaeon]
MRIDYNSEKGIVSSVRKGLLGLLGAAMVVSASEPMLQISSTTVQTSTGPKPGVSLVWSDSMYVTNNIAVTNGNNVVTNQEVRQVQSNITDTNKLYTLQSRTNLLTGRWGDVSSLPGNGYQMSTKQVSDGAKFYRIVATPVSSP